MPLINLSKEELKKIKFYLLQETDPKGRFTDPLVVSILEKIKNFDDLCECGGKTNWYIIQHKWGSYYVRWGNQNLYNYLEVVYATRRRRGNELLTQGIYTQV